MASAEPVVQVNVYGTTLADMLHNGVNLPHILSMHGYKDCVIFDVPQRKQKKRTRRSSIDSDDDMASLSSDDDEEQMKEASHRPQEKPHPRRSLLNCSLSTISGSGNHFQNPEAVPFDKERVKTEEASPEPEERENREDRDEHCGENEEEGQEDVLADSDRNGSQDERVDSFEREDDAGVDLLDTALLPPSEVDLTLSFNASVADCLLDLVEQVCASSTPAPLPSYEALEGTVFCEPIVIDSCDASGSREISRLSRKRTRRGLSPPSKTPSASRTLPITRNLAPSVASWCTAPERLTPVDSELRTAVSNSRSVLEEEEASGAVPAQEIGPNTPTGEDSRLLHGFMGGELGFFDEFSAGPIGNPSDTTFTSSPSIFPDLDFSFHSNAYDDPLDDDLAMLYTNKEQAAAEVALDEDEERPHEEMEDGDEFYDCCSAGEEEAAQEGTQGGDCSMEEEEEVVESSGEEEEEDAGSHNESLVKKKKKMRIYSLEGKKFFCQYKYCNKSIVWRKGYGSNRFLTHVRTHFNRSVYKCALCNHKDLHEFKIRYHHRKNHDGLPWTAPLNVESKEDVEELLKLWKECFPDRSLVPPFSLLKS